MKKAKKTAVKNRKKTAPVKPKPKKKLVARGGKKAVVVPSKPKMKPLKAKPVPKAVTPVKASVAANKVKSKINLALKSGLKPLPKPLPSEVKEEKKPRELYSLEYMVGSSPDILFEFISTAAGLEKWFAKKVNVHENVFTFIWDKDEEEQARLIALKDREFARFHWLGQADRRYFEFRIQIDDLTGEVGLIVSDFADSQQERESAQREWDLQIHNLQHALGSP